MRNLQSARPVTFVVTRTGGTVFEQNFAISPCLKDARVRQVIVQQGFKSASLAYNEAIGRASEEIIIFCHQDLYFPESWLDELESSIQTIEQTDPRWGVLGCWGVGADGHGAGYVHSFGHGRLGAPFESPVKISTLDECVLILRKSSALTFDPELPDFHFYGTDICLSARKRDISCYAISAFCIHNTRRLQKFPPEFFDCYRHIKRVWKEYLPIITPCIRVTRFDSDLLHYKFHEFVNTLLRRDTLPRPRLEDPRTILSAGSVDLRQ
jgi:hypothetical protein